MTGFSLFVFATASGNAQLALMSDDFSRTTGYPDAPANGGFSDWGANNNALGGTLVQTYDVQLTKNNANQHYVDGSRGRLRFGQAEVNFDWATSAAVSAAGGMIIEYDFTAPLTGGTTEWISFVFGMDATNTLGAFTMVEAQNGGQSPEIAMLLRKNGTTTMKFGAVPWSGNNFTGGAWSIVGDPTVDLQHARFELTTANFNLGTSATLAAYINGMSLDLDPLGAGTTATFTWNGGPALFNWSSNQGDASIDNLVVTVIPEPAAGALMGLGLVAWLGHRRSQFARNYSQH